MTDFDWWFANVILGADLANSPRGLEQAWLTRDTTITSAYDFIEFAEQVLGDLDLENNLSRFREPLEKLGATAAMDKYVHAFREAEGAVLSNEALRQAATFLKSRHWSKLKGAASGISELPAAARFREITKSWK